MVTKDINVRKAQSDAAVDQLDIGTTDATGDIVYRTSADAVIARGALSDPAAGDADGTATATFSAIGDATVTADGTVAKATLEDKDNVERLELTVTATGSGGEIELSSTSFEIDDIIQTDSLTYQVT